MLKKLAAVSLAVGALVLTAPVAANAASDPYAKPPGASVDDPIIDTCGESTVAFGAGYFQPSETVGVTVSGTDSDSATVSGDTAAGDGSLAVTFSPSSDAEGTYAIAVTGSRSYTATVTVSSGPCGGEQVTTGTPAEQASTGAAGTGATRTGTTVSGATADSEKGTGASAAGLAATGASVSPWLVGGGAAALVAGASFAAVGVARRKNA